MNEKDEITVLKRFLLHNKNEAFRQLSKKLHFL